MNTRTKTYLKWLFFIVVGFSLLSAKLIMTQLQAKQLSKQTSRYVPPGSIVSFVDPYDLDTLYDHSKKYLPRGTHIPNIIFDTRNPEDTLDLAFTIWCEVRSVSGKGYDLMPSVVMNRLDDPAWGNSISDVLHEPAQFSCWGKDGKSPVREVTEDLELFNKAVLEAHAYINREKLPVTTARYYHTYATKVKWSKKLAKVENDGAHYYFDKNVKRGR